MQLAYTNEPGGNPYYWTIQGGSAPKGYSFRLELYKRAGFSHKSKYRKE